MADTILSVPMLSRFQLGAYFHASAIALFVYDYLLTWFDETRLVWRRPFTLISYLFILNRYLPFIDLSLSMYNQVVLGSTPNRCKIVDSTIGVLFFFGVLLSELLMVLRVWILWGKSRRMMVVLTILSMVTLFAAILSYVFAHNSLAFLSLPNFPGCVSRGGTKLDIPDYVLLMSFEFVMVILTIIPYVKHRTRAHSVGNFVENLVTLAHPGSSIVGILARDGICYFVLLASISLVNVVFMAVESNSGFEQLIAFQRAMHSALVSRIVIYMRKARSQTDESLRTSELPLTVVVTQEVLVMSPIE